MKARVVVFRAMVIIFLVTVSVSAGPKFTEEADTPEGKALVYIYCPKSHYHSAASAIVLANAEPVIVLFQGTYFPLYITPGTIDF